MTKREIMIRAHQIAKALEGDYIARMSEALRMAWAEARRPKYAELELRAPNKKQKTWVAKIVGTHPVYKWDRKFVNSIGWGEYTWELTDGIYEVCENGNRYFIRVTAGQAFRIEADEVAA